MTETLTREQAVSTLRDIIKEYGEDYVYEKPRGRQCSYRKIENSGIKGTPSCIVGHLVAKLYPEVFRLIGSPEGVSNHAPSLSLVGYPSQAEQYTNIPINAESDDLARELASLQAKQDNGEPWGNAFRLSFGEEV